MEIFNDQMKAYDCAIRRFFRQKSDDPVYIYRTSVARREMWTVLSTTEITANKISAKSCYTAVDGRYGLLEHKHSRQEQLEKNPEIPLLIKSMRGLRQHYKAQKKLEKMGRDAEGVKRPVEVTSDSGQKNDPSN